MIDLSKLNIDYTPYPIGVASGIFEPELYKKIIQNYPDIEKFDSMGETKLSLNDKNPYFWKVIKENPIWKEFHGYINTKEFIDSVFKVLASQNVDLGFKHYKFLKRDEKTSRIFHVYNALRGRKAPIELETKLEFSALHPNGGAVWPHTDSKHKVATLVLSITEEDEWDIKWGGGTSSLELKDNSRVFDRTNKYKPEFKDVNIIKTYDFKENQCLLFVKTFNSWHAVMPMHNKHISKLRKSLTINIIQR